MAHINECVFGARLWQDAELRYTANGTGVLKFGFVVANRKPDRDNPNGPWIEQPLWLRGVYFGKNADKLAAKLLKGTNIVTIGEIEPATIWQPDSGDARVQQDFRARHIVVTDKVERSDEDGEGGYTAPTRQRQPAATAQRPQQRAAAAEEEDFSDLPF